MTEIKCNGHLIPFAEIPKVADILTELGGSVGSFNKPTAIGSSPRSRSIDTGAYEPMDLPEDSLSSESEREVRPSKVSFSIHPHEGSLRLTCECSRPQMLSTPVVSLQPIQVLTSRNVSHQIA